MFPFKGRCSDCLAERGAGPRMSGSHARVRIWLAYGLMSAPPCRLGRKPSKGADRERPGT
jgi:hypothetical protein